MMHSLYFGDVNQLADPEIMTNTYEEWKIVPTSRPVIKPPALKKKTLDIPGANGSLDISEALTGFPVFENRTGSIEFVVLNDFDLPDYKGYRWDYVYHDILWFLHGEQFRMVLEDEPEYFYEGRFTINDWTSGKDHSTITIDYDLSPYRWSKLDSIDGRWLWDPFNFERDYISSLIFGNIVVNGTETRTMTADKFGTAPLMPEYIITIENNKPMTVTVTTKTGTTTKTFNTSGTYKIYERTIYKSDVTFSFSGNGVVSIRFYRGYL